MGGWVDRSTAETMPGLERMDVCVAKLLRSRTAAAMLRARVFRLCVIRIYASPCMSATQRMKPRFAVFGGQVGCSRSVS